jgi:hypothetical protein
MKHRILKYLKIVILVAIVGAAITGAVIWARTPTQGRILSPPPLKGPTTYYDKKLNGRYMSFQYSGKYSGTEQEAKDNTLERYVLNADTHYDKRLLASVGSLPDGKLESDGSYIYRQKSPNIYTNRKVSVNGVYVNVWVKHDNMEQTAMIAHGDKVAVLSFVTANPSDDLTGEMNALLKTFEWKR